MYVIIPIEVYGREIEKACALGAYIYHKKNIKIIIAEQKLARKLALNFGEKAIFIGKHFFHENSKEIFDKSELYDLIRRNVNIIFIDEEGGLFINEDSLDYSLEQLKLRYPFQDIEESRRDQIKICHWGQFQFDNTKYLNKNYDNFLVGAPFVDCAKLFRSSKNKSNNIVNPKISFTQSYNVLCRKGFNCENINSLIDYLSDSYINEEVFFLGILNELILFGAYKKLLEYKDLDIKWRPHPSARSKLSLNYLKNISRERGIEAISRPSRQPIYDYLTSADIFIHSGCTTSIQSRLLGKPTIYLRSRIPGRSLHVLNEKKISEVNEQFYDEIIKTTNMQFPNNQNSFTPFTYNLLSNLKSRELESFKNISEIVEIFLKKKSSKNVNYFLNNQETINFVTKNSKKIYPNKIKKIFRESPIFPNSHLYSKYGLYKFKMINKKDVLNVLNKLEKNIKPESKIKPTVDDYFVIFQ